MRIERPRDLCEHYQYFDQAIMQKQFISANELLEDAYTLAINILRDGFLPDLLIGLWRGGTPIAIAVHEVMKVSGLSLAHLPLKTASYSGIAQRAQQVRIDGLQQLDALASRPADVLVVDDVFDTGNTLAAILEQLQQHPVTAASRIRLATVWWKPAQNQTTIQPDYWLHESDQWLVFPHELDGLSAQELVSKPGAATVAAFLSNRA